MVLSLIGIYRIGVLENDTRHPDGGVGHTTAERALLLVHWSRVNRIEKMLLAAEESTRSG